MANPVEEGTYRLRVVAKPLLCASAYAANVTNGTNVLFWEHSASSIAVDINWQLTYRSNGTAQFTNAYSGKCLDVAGGQVYQGSNVQQYTDNDTRAQTWSIEAVSGKTCTWNGTSYQVYKIRLYGTNYLLETYGDGVPVNGENICIAEDQGTVDDQLWIFEPVPQLQSGGTYELRSVLDTKYALEVSYESKTNEATIGVAPTNGGNHQKWVITKESDTENKWKLKNVNSKMVMVVNGPSIADGKPIFQYVDDNGADQRWCIESVGSRTLNGVNCMVVTIASAYTGLTGDEYYACPYTMLLGRGGNDYLTVNTPPEQSQMDRVRWVLYPTTATDSDMPVPANMGLSPEKGNTSKYLDVIGGARYYPTWTATQAWCSDGANHYELRQRTRYMSAATSTWQDWGSWSSWKTVLANVSGQRVWESTGAYLDPGHGDYAAYKKAQWQYQVRSVGANEAACVYGNAATCDTYWYWRPTITFEDATVIADGLRIGFTSDYTAGSNTIHVDSIKTAKGTELIASTQTFTGLSTLSSILIKSSALLALPASGEQITITYRVGNDMWESYGGIETATETVDYTGNAMIDVVLEPSEYLQGKLTITNLTGTAFGSVHVHVYSDGYTYEVDEFTYEGKTVTCSIPYPLTGEFSVWVDTTDVAEVIWGVEYLEFTREKLLALGFDLTPKHVFTWDGGGLEIAWDEDVPKASYSYTPDAEELALNGRSAPVVVYGSASKREWKVTGVIPASAGTAQSLVALADARHALYRSPMGDMADVAITAMSYEQQATYTSVDITAVEEAI